jgi:hypothetical protein
MRLLICGGRNFNDMQRLEVVMNHLNFEPSIIIEGGCTGADRLAREWAKKYKIHYATVPALWEQFGNPAGRCRNSAMLLPGVSVKPHHFRVGI